MDRMKPECRLRWRYLAGDDAMIWRLMFTRSGALVGQKRCLTQRRSLFFSIDDRSGQILFDDYLLLISEGGAPAGEGWFTGIETVSENYVYFHSYQESSPEHIGLWAADAATGRMVWFRGDIVYCITIDEGFLVYIPSVFAGFPERNYLIIDPLTGRELRRPGNDSGVINALRLEAVFEEERQEVTLPEFAVDGSVQCRMLRGAGVAAPEYAECLTVDNVTAAAIHERHPSSGAWQSTLCIVHDGQLLYEDIIAGKRDAPAVNSFLLRNRGLYYIKEASELIVVDI